MDCLDHNYDCLICASLDSSRRLKYIETFSSENSPLAIIYALESDTNFKLFLTAYPKMSNCDKQTLVFFFKVQFNIHSKQKGVPMII